MPTPQLIVKPTRESVAVALANLIAITRDGVFFTRATGLMVDGSINENTASDAIVLANSLHGHEITLGELLEASIVDGFQVLDLPSGVRLELLLRQRATFTPALGNTPHL